MDSIEQLLKNYKNIKQMSRSTRYVLQRTDLLYALVFVYYPGIFWYPLGAFKLTNPKRRKSYTLAHGCFGEKQSVFHERKLSQS